jgi:hypothetical protein
LTRDVSADARRAEGSDPIAPKITSVAAAVLVLLTCVHAYSRRGTEAEQPSPREVAYSREAMVTGSGRCALYHARFGGQRAQLIKVMRGGVSNYVVLEVGKRDPSMRSLRSNWLKANYGAGEPVWLGEYGSADTALARAARLCPPASRCWPGEAGCGPEAQSQSPAQVFFGR